MPLLGDVIARTHTKILATYQVDVGLNRIKIEQSDDCTISEMITAVRQELAARSVAVREAQAAIAQLSETLAHLGEILPFTAEGWPAARTLLAAASLRNAEEGVAAWLDYWFVAAGDYRLEALRWIEEDVTVPEPWRLAGERAAAARRALALGEWNVLEPVLRTGVEGLQLAGRRVPDQLTSEKLALVLARLALVHGHHDHAFSMLEGLRSRDTEAACLALRARLARLRGDIDMANECVEQAQDRDPRDLDVTVELVARSRRQDKCDIALDAARATIDAFQSLEDVNVALDKLLLPVPEIWLAVSERWQREGDTDRALAALDRAAAELGSDDDELCAVVYESRARLGGTASGRGRDLVTAAGARQRRGEFDRALRAYEDALRLCPPAVEAVEHAQWQALWAECVAVGLGMTSAIDEDVQARALDVAVAVRGQLGVEEYSWLFVVEMALHLALSVTPGRARAQHEWSAVLAIARSICFAPAIAQRWTLLSVVLQDMGMYRVGAAAAEHALKLEPDEPAGRDVAARAAANLGNFDDALRLLGDTDDPWSQTVRATSLFRLGEIDAAVAILDGLVIEPTWAWAWETLLSGLVIQGDIDRARRESVRWHRSAEAIEDRTAVLKASIYRGWMHGEFASALDHSRDLVAMEQGQSTENMSEYGESLLLVGDPAGWAHMREYLDRYPHGLALWNRGPRRMLEVLARNYGAALPDSEIPSSIDMIEESRTAEEELASEAAGAATRIPDASPAAFLTLKVISSVSGGSSADSKIDALAADFAFDEEVRALSRKLADENHARDDTSERGTTEERPVDSNEEPRGRFSIYLNTRWFEATPDPEREHEIFLRYLPQVRLLAADVLPPVTVHAIDDLPRGQFWIARDETLLDLGELEVDARYCPEELLSALGVAASSLTSGRPSPYGWAVPGHLLDDHPTMREMFTMGPAEVVARAFVVVAQRHDASESVKES